MAKRKPKNNHNPSSERVPKFGERPTGGRNPVMATSAEDPANVTWRFGLIDFDGPWCWASMSEEDRKTVYSTLAENESRRWRDIPKNQVSIGSVKAVNLTGKVPSDLVKRLRDLKMDDLDNLWEFRISNKKRVWGVLRPPGTFDFLWWDPEHTVWPSKQRRKPSGNK